MFKIISAVQLSSRNLRPSISNWAIIQEIYSWNAIPGSCTDAYLRNRRDVSDDPTYVYIYLSTTRRQLHPVSSHQNLTQHKKTKQLETPKIGITQ